MADEEALNAEEEVLDSTVEDVEETTEDSPITAIEQRIVALEAAQRQSVLEIRSAVGRVQSIAAKLEKTNNPETEAKLRSELAGVSELLGLVTDSIDESILPRDVKQRVANAQETVRRAATDAEINRRIEAATANLVPQPSGINTDAIEAAAIAQIQSLGLNHNDPAFDWRQAASLLHTQGEAAMWAYFGEVERTLLTTEAGPQRRTKAAPRAASVSQPKTGVEAFLDKDTPLEEKLAQMRAQGMLT